MATPDDRALAVALQLLDGERPDWDSLQTLVDPDDYAVVEGLRTLAPMLQAGQDGEPRRSWGDLRLLERIGSGMEGDVYRVWDDRLGREVALKLMRPAPDAAVGAALLDEARRLAQLKHPGIVTVYGADRHDGRVGFWMELLPGRPLSDLLAAQGRFGAREATLIGLDLCRALAAVHAAGLIHRDLKADNVLREDGGRIVLTDFGSGVQQAAPGTGAAGTPLYMPPEVLRGEAPSVGADLYSLGVLLYHLVTGGYPVRADTIAALRDAHAADRRTRLRDARPDLPAAFVTAVEKSLAPAGERFRTAGEMEAALVRALEPEGRRQWLVSLALALVAVLVGVVVWTGKTPLPTPMASLTTPAPEGIAAAPVRLRLLAARDDGRTRPLTDGDVVAPGDRLFLEAQAPFDTYVYVVDEDEQGNAYLLFPLPDSSVSNPLPAGRSHHLPGVRDGHALDWQVTSSGGREHILVLASRELQPAFEKAIAPLSPAALGRPVTALPIRHDVVGRLRGIAGVVEVKADGSARSVRALAESLAGDVTHGPWLREIVLSNP